MCLSVFDIPAAELDRKESLFARELEAATLFGSGARFREAADHPVMDREAFRDTPLLRSLHGRAWKQLGTSGGGNHFVEFGRVEVAEHDPVLGLAPGHYVGLLSHSGSRGLGANIANHYTRIARAKRRLPQEATHLAWLTLDEMEGMEYWTAMNLAGDYASACHDVIHVKIATALSRLPIRVVQNHHNFAWREVHNGRDLIVHRKGATPAGKNILGIIPGSMTAPGFIVKGKGAVASLDSAAHGAGRKLSRSAASASITHHAFREELDRHGVRLIGGGLDEAPFAYKDIAAVMRAQTALVDVVGTFQPRIVRMDG
jgi:tRNA-splicing ligase RtcB